MTPRGPLFRRHHFPTPLLAGLAVLAMLVMFGLTGFAQAQDAEEDAPIPKVAVAAAYTQPVTNEIVFIGRGEAIDKVEIVARVQGFLEEKLVNDGVYVAKDDPLFTIEKDAYEAALEARRADLSRAEAELELARLDLFRKEELLSRGSTPEAERDVARANELVAEANVRSAKAAIQQAELDLSYTGISAPFPGRIGKIEISVGDIVGPTNPPLVTLVREAPINVAFSLSEKQLIDVLEQVGEKPEDIARASPEVFLSLPNGTELDEVGRITYIDNRINPQTGSITVRAQFENAKGLIVDGSFMHVRIQASEPVDRILIPQAAVQRDQKGDFVLVVGEQQTVEQRHITTGDQVETAIIVLDGLREGETVIVEGLQRVRPGVKVDSVLASSPAGD